MSIVDSWEDWFGTLTLQGIDPRQWDLKQTLAAYEAALRQSAKDEAEWNKTRARLYAPPRTAGKPQQRGVGMRGAAMTAAQMQSLIALAQRQDEQYGSDA